MSRGHETIRWWKTYRASAGIQQSCHVLSAENLVSAIVSTASQELERNLCQAEKLHIRTTESFQETTKRNNHYLSCEVLSFRTKWWVLKTSGTFSELVHFLQCGSNCLSISTVEPPGHRWSDEKKNCTHHYNPSLHHDFQDSCVTPTEALLLPVNSTWVEWCQWFDWVAVWTWLWHFLPQWRTKPFPCSCPSTVHCVSEDKEAACLTSPAPQ